MVKVSRPRRDFLHHFSVVSRPRRVSRLTLDEAHTATKGVNGCPRFEPGLKHFHLTLDDVAITHLTFGREFMKAIEAKQVASQEAERQQWVVKRAEQERQAVVTRAEGEAEAAAIITNAMEQTGNAIIEVRRIDAAKEIAHKLANSRNITYLPSGSSGQGQGGGPGLLLNIDK